MTQGDPLSMVVYEIGVPYLMKNLKDELPDVTQPKYADNDGAIYMFANNKLYFNQLKQFFPRRGYYPKPSKSFLIVHLENLEVTNFFGLSHGFKVCTGACYLGEFIGYEESKRECLKELTKAWEQNITKKRKTTGKYPQESYSTVVRMIQPKWIFLQRVTKNMGVEFAGVEKLLQEKIVLPFLQKVKISHTSHRNSKYYAGQQIRPGTPEYRDLQK